jgi:hypothetical protein
MDDELEQFDDEDLSYYEGDLYYDDDYYDDEDDDWYHDDEEEYHYWCDICDAMDEDPCNDFIHELHDKARAALDPQLDYWNCGRCGGILKFHRRHNADWCVSEEYAIAQCSECYQSYTVLHTPDTKRVLGVYAGIHWFDEGDPNDQPETASAFEGPPF